MSGSHERFNLLKIQKGRHVSGKPNSQKARHSLHLRQKKKVDTGPVCTWVKKGDTGPAYTRIKKGDSSSIHKNQKGIHRHGLHENQKGRHGSGLHEKQKERHSSGMHENQKGRHSSGIHENRKGRHMPGFKETAVDPVYATVCKYPFGRWWSVGKKGCLPLHRSRKPHSSYRSLCHTEGPA